MLHLPALTESGAMPRVSSNLSKLGLTLRGTYGEGSKITGALYQLSNQITLGLSESEAVENLRAITVQLMEEERKARIEAKKRARERGEPDPDDPMTKRRSDREKLAAARKRDAEKYGETYKEVTDDDLR